MGKRTGETWTVDLPEGRHQVDVDYGYWLGKATLRVDGRVVSQGRPIMDMSHDMGVDLPTEVDGHAIVISVRPVLGPWLLVRGYRFGITVDGSLLAGAETVPALQPNSNPLLLGRERMRGAQRLEMFVWSSTGGVFVALGSRGNFSIALLYLVAPLACSWVARQTRLPLRLMVVLCAAIMIGWLMLTAVLVALAR